MEWRLTFHVGVSHICKGSETAWGMVCICRGYILSRRWKWQPTPVSCLENPMDRGAWRAAVHGVAQSQTRLKWCSDGVAGGVGSEAGVRFPSQGSGSQLPLNWSFLEGRDYVFCSLTSEALFPSPLFITKQDPACICWLAFWFQKSLGRQGRILNAGTTRSYLHSKKVLPDEWWVNSDLEEEESRLELWSMLWTVPRSPSSPSSSWWQIPLKLNRAPDCLSRAYNSQPPLHLGVAM